MLRKIKKFFIEKQELTKYKRFFSEIPKPEESKNQKILMYVGIGYMYLTPFETTLYHYLKSIGYDVDYVIYDENIPICELTTQKVIESNPNYWKNDVKKAKNILKAAKIPYQFISKTKEFLNIENSIKPISEINFDFSYDNIDFGDIVKGVMYRYYKSLTFGKDAPEISRKFLETTLTNYTFVKELNSKKKYDYIMFSHGIYCTWEPIMNYCKKNNIPFICYDRAKTQSTINININQVGPDWDFSTAWVRYKEKNLNQIEYQQVKNYLNERILQKNDVYQYNSTNKIGDINKLKTSLIIPENKRVITFFSNLIWDAANVSRDIAFDSAISCIQETIEYIKNNPNVIFLLRSHPAEKVLGTKERYGDLIENHFGILPENVRIIKPEDDINSFDILDITDIGIVNTSTVGLELAMLDKPVMLISETHYRNKGFTYDIKDKNHFFEVLDYLLNSTEVGLDNQKELSYKYFYMMMFLYQHKIPIQYLKSTFVNFSEKGILKIKNYTVFKNVFKNLNVILNNKDCISW